MGETVLDGMFSMDMGEKVVVVPGVAEIEQSMQRFKWPDYLMFALMLVVCIVIGIYYGFYRTSKNKQDYLMGGRKMKIVPIGLSLVATFTSGISMLGIPTETYLYGIQLVYLLGGLTIMGIIMNNVFLPVFYKLNLTSIYEYHEKRFDKNVRIFSSVLFAIDMMTWLPIVIYVLALAVNQVTGINIHLVTPVVSIVCMFYTSFGGLKAVVWSDVFQSIMMLSAVLLVAVKGTIDIGGFNTVWQKNLESGRIEPPNLDFSFRSRYTFWTLTIGGCIYYLQSASINQNMLQRYLSLPSLNNAKKAVWFCVFGISTIIIICGYCGILIYATFYKCDPLTTKLAKEKDQLLPLLVMQVLGDYPGLSGIFVAGILSASLSSLSTGLNAMSAIVLEDFYPFFFSKSLTEKQSSLLMKATVIVFGTICVALVYVIEKFGSTVLQLTLSFGSISTGPSLGMFTLGVLLPWINAKGALIGGTSSLLVMTWICVKAQSSIASGDLFYPEKPLNTEECHYHFIPNKKSVSINIHFNISDNPEEQFILHHVSYMWYALIGTCVTVVVGVISSFLTHPLDPRDVDPDLLASCVRKFIKPREFPNEPNEGIIYAYDNANQKNDKPNIALEAMEEPKS